MTATAHPILRAGPRSGRLLDLALTLIAVLGTLALFPHGDTFTVQPGLQGLDGVGILATGLSTLPLLVWRRFPLGVFVATGAAAILLAGLGHGLDFVPGPVVALYLLASSRDSESPWTRGTWLTVIGVLAVYVTTTAAARAGFPGNELAHIGLAWAVAWFAGERTRLRRDRVIELKERALRAERENERERLLAVAEERARIARDLHDSAGHAINVIAVQAGAARLRSSDDPRRAQRALEAIEEVARETVEEIDNIVGTLRDSSSARRPVEDPPGLASVDSLVTRHAQLGHEVTYETTGVSRPLSAAADQAAYRILQEALTNAVRHGPGSVRVEISYGERAAELTVTNPVAEGSADSSGGGHGIIGMQERATLMGGSLDVERSNGVFQLVARIPYRVRL